MKTLNIGSGKYKDNNGEWSTLPCLKGDKGDTGESAYQLAVRLGTFTGTEEEYNKQIADAVDKADTATKLVKKVEDQIQKNTIEIDSLKEKLGDLSKLDFDAENIIDAVNKAYNHGESVDGSDGTYDLEIKLPYTAKNDTKVKVCAIPKGGTSQVSGFNLLKSLDESGLNINRVGNVSNVIITPNYNDNGVICTKIKHEGAGYINFTSQKTDEVYGDSIWFCYVKCRLLGDKGDKYVPSTLCHVSTNLNIITGSMGQTMGSMFKANETTWQECYCAGRVTQSDVYINLNAILGFSNITGTILVENITIVNLTKNGLTNKTVNELVDHARKHDFDINTLENYSVKLINGTEEVIIPSFKKSTIKKYFTVKAGDTLTSDRINGYLMPTIEAYASSNTNTSNTNDEDLLVNSRFKDCKVVFEGDSITDFDYLPEYDNKSWATYLADILRLDVVGNLAVGGSLISHGNEAVGFSVQQRIVNATYPDDTKLFVIMAGTNDWGSGVSLGDATSTDISTVCGALNNIIDDIQTKCKDATIVIISPIHRTGDNGGLLNNNKGYSLLDIANVYEKVCKRWGAKFINGLSIGINCLNELSRDMNYVDGLHPTPTGHKKISVEIARQIATF